MQPCNVIITEKEVDIPIKDWRLRLLSCIDILYGGKIKLISKEKITYMDKANFEHMYNYIESNKLMETIPLADEICGSFDLKRAIAFKDIDFGEWSIKNMITKVPPNTKCNVLPGRDISGLSPPPLMVHPVIFFVK